jgi:hypothetical protein
MSRLDDDFVNELEGRIDETFKEKQDGESEATGDHGDTVADENNISNLDGLLGTHGDVVGQNEAETAIFDVTEEELFAEKKQSHSSGSSQARGAGTSSRPYHPMEMLTNIIVTRENVEFAIRKFVKDLNECLRLSKAISIRFRIKTLSNDNGHR